MSVDKKDKGWENDFISTDVFSINKKNQLDKTISGQLCGDLVSFDELKKYLKNQDNAVFKQFMSYFLFKGWVKLSIDKTISTSRTDRFHKTMVLWLSNDDQLKSKMWIVGFPEKSSNINWKYYTFIHEISHNLLWYMFENQKDFPYFWLLYKYLEEVRNRNGQMLGLSKLASSPFYTGKTYVTSRWEVKHSTHDEDFVELLSMYIYDKNLFAQIVDNLPSIPTIWKNGLAKINYQDCEMIKKCIVDCVDRLVTQLK